MNLPILHRLSQERYYEPEEDNPTNEGRVLEFEISEDLKSITFTEMCDQWFSTKLTKSEFMQMIEELKQVADTMLD